jgi:hypothetical protein
MYIALRSKLSATGNAEISGRRTIWGTVAPATWRVGFLFSIVTVGGLLSTSRQGNGLAEKLIHPTTQKIADRAEAHYQHREGSKMKSKEPKFQVLRPRHSGGPKFSSLTEALAYIRHSLKSGEDSMSIGKL